MISSSPSSSHVTTTISHMDGITLVASSLSFVSSLNGVDIGDIDETADACAFHADFFPTANLKAASSTGAFIHFALK